MRRAATPMAERPSLGSARKARSNESGKSSSSTARLGFQPSSRLVCSRSASSPRARTSATMEAATLPTRGSSRPSPERTARSKRSETRGFLCQNASLWEPLKRTVLIEETPRNGEGLNGRSRILRAMQRAHAPASPLPLALPFARTAGLRSAPKGGPPPRKTGARIPTDHKIRPPVTFSEVGPPGPTRAAVVPHPRLRLPIPKKDPRLAPMRKSSTERVEWVFTPAGVSPSSQRPTNEYARDTLAWGDGRRHGAGD